MNTYHYDVKHAIDKEIKAKCNCNDWVKNSMIEVHFILP